MMAKISVQQPMKNYNFKTSLDIKIVFSKKTGARRAHSEAVGEVIETSAVSKFGQSLKLGRKSNRKGLRNLQHDAIKRDVKMIEKGLYISD